MKNFEAVTYEFFGMEAAVPQAVEAMDFATARLRAAFGNLWPTKSGNAAYCGINWFRTTAYRSPGDQ